MDQVYRASVGAIIVDSNYNFLMIQSVRNEKGKLEFVKGGMDEGEDTLDTVKREMEEEVGKNMKYEIIDKSNWYFVYDWNKEHQKQMGFRGQVRHNYWIKYLGGQIILQEEEISDYYRIPESKIIETLKKSKFPQSEIDRFLKDFERIKQITKKD